MNAKQLYTETDCIETDCIETDFNCSISGKIVVLDRSVLPQYYPSQLFYCAGGNGANANPIDHLVTMVSLSDGEFSRWKRSDVVGVLKPELLPDSAKLQLSQIRPGKGLDLNSNEPKYSGYSFLPDGRYASGIWLCNKKEVIDYVEMQKPYQHRIMICDRDDFCVLEMHEQKLIYPTAEELQSFSFLEPEQSGGMQMT